MEMRTYQASTMAKALEEVKRELGRDALIVKTRRFRKGALLGVIGGQSMWEIRAASPADVGAGAGGGLYVPIEELSVPSRTAEPAAASAPPREAQITVRMNEIHQMVEKLLQKRTGRSTELPPVLESLRSALLDQDVAETIASQLIYELQQGVPDSDLSDPEMLKDKLVHLIAARIRTSVTGPAGEGEGPRVIALIGPTGVGKTTTIAKLAANYHLREKKRVGLITIDTYRIAAVDQLRTYAEIIKVPMKAVLTPGELYQAIQGMRSMDVVLIDTAGRSQNDQMRVNQLGAFLGAANCDEIHLVISAATNPRVGMQTLDRFGRLSPNRILITKLDEAVSFGMILNVAAASDATVSYITTGQDVPDDMAPGDPQFLARCIVKGRWDGG